MSNYNTEPVMFRMAIESILNQTLQDFELILIDDKSTNEKSKNIIDEYAKKDSRIVAIYNKVNMGLAGALNEGLKVAQGKYIARFDTDDICVKDRFEKQIKYMRANCIDVCSTFAHLFGACEDVVSTSFYSSEAVAAQLLFSCYIYHPSVMMTRFFLNKNELTYDTDFDGAEDFDLFTRCRNEGAKICIMPKVLFHYRIHSSSVCFTQKPKQIVLSKRICQRQLDWMKINYSDNELNLHYILCGLEEYTEDNYEMLDLWCKKLIETNKIGQYFDTNIFSKIVYNRFLNGLIKSNLQLSKKIRYICKNKNLFSISNIYSVIYKKVYPINYRLKGGSMNARK
nr:glycosyltransferase [Sporofaciens musculi]